MAIFGTWHTNPQTGQWGEGTFADWFKQSPQQKWLNENWRGIEGRGWGQPGVFLGVDPTTGEQITAPDMETAIYMKDALQRRNVTLRGLEEGETLQNFGPGYFPPINLLGDLNLPDGETPPLLQDLFGYQWENIPSYNDWIADRKEGQYWVSPFHGENKFGTLLSTTPQSASTPVLPESASVPETPSKTDPFYNPGLAPVLDLTTGQGTYNPIPGQMPYAPLGVTIDGPAVSGSSDWITNAQNPAPVVLPPSTNPMLSGQEFAKMISGGQAVPSMFAPGVSYSSAQPMGYTAPGASVVPFPSYTGPMNVNPDTQPPPPPVEGTSTPVTGVDIGGGSEIQEYINNLYGLLDDPNTYINWGFDPSTVVNDINPDIGEDITFDPSAYDWSTIFDQYSTTPDLSNYLTQSDLPTYESPDLSNYLTSADLPTYTQFDPTTYDWSNIFSQPDLSNYALLSDIPTNNPIDTSSFVTQDQLSNLLASINTSSNQFNNNNFPLDTTDIIPLGSYSLLNR